MGCRKCEVNKNISTLRPVLCYVLIMRPVIQIEFRCPYCWQANTVTVDAADSEDQSFTVDCEVCCRPVSLRVNLDGNGDPMVDATAELSE